MVEHGYVWVALVHGQHYLGSPLENKGRRHKYKVSFPGHIPVVQTAGSPCLESICSNSARPAVPYRSYSLCSASCETGRQIRGSRRFWLEALCFSERPSKQGGFGCEPGRQRGRYRILERIPGTLSTGQSLSLHSKKTGSGMDPASKLLPTRPANRHTLLPFFQSTQ
jgi:hypothetical protein